jgi:hypothetical protein
MGEIPQATDRVQSILAGHDADGTRRGADRMSRHFQVTQDGLIATPYCEEQFAYVARS